MERVRLDKVSKDLGLWSLDAPESEGGMGMPYVALVGVNEVALVEHHDLGDVSGVDFTHDVSNGLDLLGWIGVLLVAQPPALFAPAGLATAAQPLPPDGVLLAVVGALFTALAYVSVRSLARSEHPLVIVFWFPLVAALMSLPAVLLHPVLPQGPEWLWLLGVGLFTQLGQLGLTYGLARLPAARATAISYSQVAFAGLWGWLLFAEALDGWTSLGAVLILAAVLLGR
jgi:drug/metabolite transporter (DMT)-like permease